MNASTTAQKYWLTYHVYGKNAALSFEESLTRANIPTVCIDAALNNGNGGYNWNRKIRIQLTSSELPAVAAVFLGFLPRCEFTNHGEQSDKGFSIERQEHGFFTRVFAKGEKVRAVPVTPHDAFYVCSLVIRQIVKGQPWLTADAVTAMLRGAFLHSWKAK